MRIIRDQDFYESQKINIQEDVQRLKAHLNVKIGELVAHVTKSLKQYQLSVASKIDEHASNLLANLEKKQKHWTNRNRNTEMEAIYKDVKTILNGSDNRFENATKTFVKVKSFHEAIAKSEYKPRLKLTVDLSETCRYIDTITHTLNEGFYAAKALKGAMDSDEYCDKTKTHEIQINQLITNGNLEEFQAYLRKFPTNMRRYLLEHEYGYESILHKAVRNCDLPFLRYFVDDCGLAITDGLLESIPSKPPDLNSVEQIAEYIVNKQPGLAPDLLHLSVNLNSVSLCHLALDKYKVGVDEPNVNGEKAIFLAIQKRHWDTFLFLLERGACLTGGTMEEKWFEDEDFSKIRQSNILHAAVGFNRLSLKFLQECLYQNQDFLYEKNEKGQMPIEFAMEKHLLFQNKKWLELLLPKVPNALHVYNRSVVKGSMNNRHHWYRDQEYIFQVLSKAIEFRDTSKLSCFQQLKWLDWKVKDPKTGLTLLHKAAKLGNIEAVNFLSRQIDVNSRAFDGQTPLHLAAFWGHFKAVVILRVRHNASVNLCDNLGRDALYRCHQGGRRGHGRTAEIELVLTGNHNQLESYVFNTSSSDEDEVFHFGRRVDRGRFYQINEADDYLSDDGNIY